MCETEFQFCLYVCVNQEVTFYQSNCLLVWLKLENISSFSHCSYIRPSNIGVFYPDFGYYWLFLMYWNRNSTIANKPSSKFKIFTEMVDLMFEIAKFDYPNGQKSKYRNDAISQWKFKNSTKSDDKKINSTKPYQKPSTKYCFRCDAILTKEHLKVCPGLHSVCVHCNKKGHIKKFCGKVGYFPCKTK